MSGQGKSKSLIFNMPFSEALERLAQTVPAELQIEIEKIRKDREEVVRYAKERQESIRKGARRSTKPFRL